MDVELDGKKIVIKQEAPDKEDLLQELSSIKDRFEEIIEELKEVR